MSLKSLSIAEYKGFFEEQIIHFAIPNGKLGSGLTLILGPNNSGKTTLIESLLIKTEKKFRESERHVGISPRISIVYSDGVSSFTNVDHGSQIKLVEGSNRHIGFEVIPSRRYWSHCFNGDLPEDAFLNQSEQQVVRTGDSLQLGGMLATINRNKDKKNKFNEIIKKITPHFTGWSIDSNDQGDYVKYVGNGTEHQSNLLGDFQKLSEQYQNKPNFLFQKLETEDIRDKWDDEKKKKKLCKVGAFDSSGNLKEACKESFERIMDKIIKHLE